jgi:hypothetical protein
LDSLLFRFLVLGEGPELVVNLYGCLDAQVAIVEFNIFCPGFVELPIAVEESRLSVALKHFRYTAYATHPNPPIFGSGSQKSNPLAQFSFKTGQYLCSTTLRRPSQIKIPAIPIQMNNPLGACEGV